LKGNPYGGPLKPGQAILAVSGDPTKPDYQTLEVLEVRATDYGFHEIDFSTGRAVIKDNSQRCVSCHGVPGEGHPVWDTFNVWPGVYSSYQGFFVKGSPELLAFQSFLQNQAKTQRYSKFWYGEISRQDRVVDQVPADGHAWGLAYNLGVDFGNLRDTQLMTYLPMTKDFAKWQFVLQSTTYCNDSIEDYLPAATKAHFRYSYADMLKSTEDAQLAYLREKQARQGNAAGPVAWKSWERTDTERMARLRYIMENRGLSMARFSYAPYSVAESADWTTLNIIVQSIRTNDFERLGVEKGCELLKQWSLQALQ
jgi:hypothetical protein